ncbi:hypothetical protein CWM22_10580 [Streptococcus suis]|nr:hypothetical protein CWM22_10580 [Streptococcus suis]
MVIFTPITAATFFTKGWERERTRLVKKRVRLPAPAQLIRTDLECKTRTNLPINHCAEMLTRTLRSEIGLFAQPTKPA